MPETKTAEHQCPRCGSLDTHFSCLGRMQGAHHYCDSCESFFLVISWPEDDPNYVEEEDER